MRAEEPGFGGERRAAAEPVAPAPPAGPIVADLPILENVGGAAPTLLAVQGRRELLGESPVAQVRQFTALIEREGDGYVALCPELDIASQGDTVEEARQNLTEALELFFESASPSEIQERLHSEVYVTRLEVAVG